MSRTERLLELIQIFRRHRQPVSGKSLARELGISIRTLYRDIATLQAQGASIEGEPGLGYVLHPGFMLPPLMFSEDELEALVLGSRWVAKSADERLGMAANNALAKIAAVIPADLRDALDASTVLVGPKLPVNEIIDLNVVRKAIRSERKLIVDYTSEQGARSRRTIWPFALGFFDRIRILVAWCELRRDIRHFRTDRMSNLMWIEERYPRRRAALLKEWRKTHPESGHAP